MSGLPIVDFKTMDRVLTRLGFHAVRQRGSHVFYRHADGRTTTVLERGDAILCTEAPGSARFVAFGTRDFYGILKTKFGVADR